MLWDPTGTYDWRDYWATWCIVNGPYVGSIVGLVWSLWLTGKKKERAATVLLLSGLLLMTAFLIRFAVLWNWTPIAFYLLDDPEFAVKYPKLYEQIVEPERLRGVIGATRNLSVALTRCVVHTLVLPTGIVALWCAWQIASDQIAGRSKWWRTGLLLGWLLICSGLSGWAVWYLWTYFSKYTGNSWWLP